MRLLYTGTMNFKRIKSHGDSFRTDDNLIKGCQSSVWIKTEYKDNKVYLWGDCDSQITKGLLPLLLRVFNEQSPEDILKSDLYFLNTTGLSAHLSPARSDRLAAIINNIKSSIEMADHSR
jgi:cysteine desulfuration protein SufE